MQFSADRALIDHFGASTGLRSLKSNNENGNEDKAFIKENPNIRTKDEALCFS